MRRGTETAHGACGRCNAVCKVERPASPWGGGDTVLTIATLGIWPLVRLAVAKPWRCATCGAPAVKFK